MINYLKSAAVLCMVTLVFSCSKDSPGPEKKTDPPTPNPPETIDLRKEILGRWDFDDTGFSLTATAPTRQVTVNGISRSIVKKMETSPVPNEENEAFIEFFDDDSYLAVDGDGEVVSGTFETEGDSKVILSDLGDITEIKIEKGKISFKFTHAETKKTTALAASKTEPIKSDDRTSKLLHTWELLPVADGKEILEEPWEIWEDDGSAPVETFEVERATITFTAFGTYIVRVYAKGGKLIETDVSNWKWHSTNPNRFVYWWAGWEADENVDFVEILELNENSLKTKESWIDEEGEEEVIVFHFKRK